MTDFKVGDKVEVIKGGPKGRVGTITEHRGAKAIWPWAVEYQKGAYGGTEYGIFNSSELKLVQPEPKFQVGAEVTFCMPDFASWQGGRGIIERGPESHYTGQLAYYVEVTEVPPANQSIRVGHKAWLYPEWLEAVATKQDFGKLYNYAEFDAKLTAKVIGSFKNAKGEAVKHPAHYGGGDNPYEAIKVIEAWGLGFNLGNAAKYLARAGKKGNKVEDLNKLIQYVQFEIAKEEAK